MFDIKSATRLFFDRPEVRRALDRGTRRALSKFGAFTRQRAKTSIRKRKAVSEPGDPPSSHEGSLRRLIYFAYDPRARSVVVGPVPFRKGVAPALLEYGGPGAAGGGRPGYWRPRPYMGPAFRKELPKAPQMFKDQFRK